MNSMKPNRLRQVLEAGGIPVGHMIWEFATRGIVPLVDSADVDFVVFDMEHSGVDFERIADLLSWARAASFAPFVRVPQGLYHFIARVMDAGAMGIMVPYVETPEQAEVVVDAVRYAPLGRRGVGLGTAHTGYAVPDPVSYFDYANRTNTVICQIESTRGLKNLEAIAAIPGVDILWVGHSDLAQSMGMPGQFDNPRFIDGLKEVVAAARANGKAAGIQPGSPEQAHEWMSLGFDVISWATDTLVYSKALSEAVAELRKKSVAAAGARR